MEEAYKEGWIRHVGVPFYPYRLIDLCQFAEITPVVKQVETHVFCQQKAAREYMDEYHVQHEVWAPLAEGRKNFFANPVMMEIGAKYRKSAVQIAPCHGYQLPVIILFL